MGDRADKNDDQEFARNADIIRGCMSGEVARLRESLGAWVQANIRDGDDRAASIAMLETAFDRYIKLLGATDAFGFIEAAYRRRAEVFRRSLQ